MQARPSPANDASPGAFAALLRRFRQSRRLTQEQLAGDAEISTRHLSYLETGKAQPSREMVLLLCSALELELRDRNLLLGAAGFAALYRVSPLNAPAMQPVQRALDLILLRQEPFGAVVMDRTWNLLRWNQGAGRIFQRFLPDLGQAQGGMNRNMAHALFAPHGLRQSLLNWEEVAALLLERLQREIALHPEDSHRRALQAELLSLGPPPARLVHPGAPALPFVPLHLRRDGCELRLFSLLTSLGTPLDVTAAELVIESFFPADGESEALLHAWAQAG
jgi:transcriptional regulator with XRE-family HTH domain